MRGILITLLLVVLAVTGITITLSNNKKKIDASKEVVDRSQIPVRVTTYTASVRSADEKVLLSATLKPNEEAKISPLTSGLLTQLTIDVGSRVSRNQQIGMIDTRLLEISLKSAKLSFSKAEADYQRAKELFDAKAGVELNVTNAENVRESARIQVEQIEQQIQNARILSPISGVVLTRSIARGEFANAGGTIATVASTSPLKATVYVNENYAYQLKQGQAADLAAQVFPGKRFPGKIIFISPKGDENHNFQVDLEVPNGGTASLKAGTSVTVSFNASQSKSALSVNQLAVMKDRAQPYVYVVKGDRVESRQVVLGQQYKDLVEVLQGVQPGEEVVISGQINLTEGRLITVVSSNK